MRIRTVMGESAHTILGGVLELWNLGSPDLAVIVFVASIVVPVTKLAILMLLLLRRRWKGEALQRSRTRLYDFINFIGQWSMLDVFVVILMSAMANFPGMSQVIAGPGAASFGLVVVLTILAAESYDPRSGWDRDPGTNIAPLEPAGPHVRTFASHAVSDAAEQCYDRT
jgi:paraquat-inducible protein A